MRAFLCYDPLSTYRPNLRIRNQYFMKLGPSAVLRAIRICSWPKVDNRNNTTRPLVTLSCASGTNSTSGIIAILYDTDQLVYYMSKVSSIIKKWYKYSGE